MIRINLVKERKKVKRESTLIWQFWLYLIIVFGMLGACSYLYWMQTQKLSQLSMDKVRLDAEIKNYEKYDKLLRELQAKLEEAKKRNEVIANLTKDKDTVVRLLALITLITPEGRVWFEEIKYYGNEVILIGFAKSNETIVELMRNLENSRYAVKESIDLIRSTAEEYIGNVLRKFEIHFRFKSFSQVLAEKGVDKLQENPKN